MRPLAVLFAATVALGYSGPAAAADATGVWITDGGKSRVEITECGPRRALCSEIVWLRQPNDRRGRPLRDGNNPNAKLRKRPIIGLPILQNLRPYKRRMTQWAGRIYNPEDGRTYTAYLTVLNETTIKLQGCALGGLICGTRMWKRYVPSEQEQAETEAQAEAAAAAAPEPESEPKPRPRPRPAAADAERLPWEQ